MTRTSLLLRLIPALAATALLVSAANLSGQSGPAVDPHAYFKALTARADHLVSYSLREPAQLAPRASGGFAQSPTREIGISYAPTRDTDPRRQDAAKVVIPADGNNLRNQVRLPLAHKGGGFMVTWDAWWGAEFAFDKAGIEDYKAFQLESGGEIWTEVRARFRRATRFPGAIALIDVRPYKGSAQTRGAALDGVRYGNGSLGGLKAHFPIAAETWTRYWVQLTPRAEAPWWDFSLWVADERRQAVQLYDKQAIKPNGAGWDRLWLEYNTSSKAVRPNRRPLVAYARNVVVLRANAGSTPLLERPTGSATAPTPTLSPVKDRKTRKDKP